MLITQPAFTNLQWHMAITQMVTGTTDHQSIRVAHLTDLLTRRFDFYDRAIFGFNAIATAQHFAPGQEQPNLHTVIQPRLEATFLA